MLGFQTSELGGNSFLWFKLLTLLYLVMAVLATNAWATCVLLKMHLWFSRSGVASASTLLIASRRFWCCSSRDDPLNSKELVYVAATILLRNHSGLTKQSLLLTVYLMWVGLSEGIHIAIGDPLPGMVFVTTSGKEGVERLPMNHSFP